MRQLSIGLLLSLLPGLAAAQVYLGNQKYKGGSTQPSAEKEAPSTKKWAVGLRFAPYLPPLDNDPALNGEKPFGDIFGDKRTIMTRLDVEYQALRLGSVASVGGAAGVGLYQKKGFGLDVDGAPTEDVNKFKIYPFALDAVLRVDYLMHKGVPLAPFIKGGFDLYYWGNKKNGEFTKFADSGAEVRGATTGLHASAGLSLDLGILDPGAAINMSHNFKVSHSYLFVAGELTKINDFGSGQSFDFSSTLINIGLLLEF